MLAIYNQMNLPQLTGAVLDPRSVYPKKADTPRRLHPTKPAAPPEARHPRNHSRKNLPPPPKLPPRSSYSPEASPPWG
jgi:hypothetical protein